VNTDEARALAAGNPLSFLHVSRAEIDLPPGTDPHADEVYDRARQNFETLGTSRLIREDAPSVYLYRLRMGTHEQIGVAACFALDEYDRDVIKKHERTRRDKEDDRTRHLVALGAQTGPVFLTYRARTEIDHAAAAASAADPIIDFEAPDGVRHTLWRLQDGERDALVDMMKRVPALYIADGHHRAASAARARQEVPARPPGGQGDDAGAESFLAVAFPDSQVQILAYNRVVKDLGGLSAAAFLESVRTRFDVAAGSATPKQKGEIAMFVDGEWYTLTLRRRAQPASSGPEATAALDVTVLHDELLAPVLNIGDIRSDPRVDFVGGGRGAGELERLVRTGRAAVAFSMYPVGVDDLMRVSDAGEIMPPKSTWFEPKLRDGLLIHVI
jgi:uncharacterized protein (DUF1015 family)